MQIFVLLVNINALEINLYFEFEFVTPWMENLYDDKGKARGKFHPITGQEVP
jgi:hypothetical protein